MDPLIYLIVFFGLLIGTLIFLSRKAELHFTILKHLHPDKLEGINSHFRLMLSYRYFTLGLINILWLFFPIYLPLKTKSDDFVRSVEQKLFKNNYYLVIVLLLYISWLFAVGLVRNSE